MNISEAASTSAASCRVLTFTPAVLMQQGGNVLLDAHYANRLQSYLDVFGHVTIMCPEYTQPQQNLTDLRNLNGCERVTVHVLPEPYREDRYFKHRRAMSQAFAREMASADVILIAPHSAFDWPTLAGLVAQELGREYGIEADWDLQSVWRQNIRAMPSGMRKFRHLLWLKGHAPYYRRLLRGAKLALLEGATVFAAYKDLTPNPHQVLNVQITDADRLSSAALRAKQKRVSVDKTLRIAYAGRLISMKGPEDWVEVLSALKKDGIDFEATWLGEGPERDRVKELVQNNGLSDIVRLPGAVSRDEVRTFVERADVFLFCHKTQESPRCLLEALAVGTPLIGYESLHARHLTHTAGGGTFVKLGDVIGLADAVRQIASDRAQLAKMMAAAYQSASVFDRDAAVQQRISLIRQYLVRA